MTKFGRIIIGTFKSFLAVFPVTAMVILAMQWLEGNSIKEFLKDSFSGCYAAVSERNTVYIPADAFWYFIIVFAVSVIASIIWDTLENAND